MSDTEEKKSVIVCKDITFLDCRYYETITDGCTIYGSPQCEICPNYVKKYHSV